MQSISEIRDEFRRFITDADYSASARKATAALAELDDSVLQRTDEHDVAMLICLAGICSGLAGEGIQAGVLQKVADRYADTSVLYTGRVLPRIKEAVDRLSEGISEKSLDKLVEVADHISQGWSGYAGSEFPDAFSALAGKLGAAADRSLFLETSFISWRRGLAECATGDPESALEFFRLSLDKYREFSGYVDAVWLHTDLVIAQLMAEDVEAAESTVDAQRRYVDGVIAEAGRPPAAGASYAFHLGDVRSGGYSSFADSVGIGPQGLTSDDRALLQRYLRVSESLLSYTRSHARRDLDAAVDLFSFGWLGYLSSPYPAIFRRLARRTVGELPAAAVLLTVHVRWRGLLLAGQVRINSTDLIRTVADLCERLRAAGLDREADIALLDGAMLHFALYGKAATATWLSRRLGELRERVPGPLHAVVEALRVPPQAGLQAVLANYLGARSLYRVPDFMPALMLFGRDRGSRPELRDLELAIYGETLLINGITVHEHTPPALTAIFEELARDFLTAREQQQDVPLVSAAELAARTGRTGSAVAQVVRRFRVACQEQFDRSTGLGPEPDRLLQGRPGYRLNPLVLGEVEIHLLP